MRGGRQRAHTKKQPAAEPPRRLASLPPQNATPRTATDAPPITVLRVGPQKRYAQAGRAPATLPLPSQAASATRAVLNVIRGARTTVHVLPLPYVQPGPRILRISN